MSADSPRLHLDNLTLRATAEFTLRMGQFDILEVFPFDWFDDEGDLIIDNDTFWDWYNDKGKEILRTYFYEELQELVEDEGYSHVMLEVETE